MKALGIQVGVTVLILVLLAIGLGVAVSLFGGAGAVRVLRDLGIIILAIFSLVMAIVPAAIYFVAAWAVGRYGGKAIGGVRWVGGKTLWVEERAGAGVERFAIRPFARTTGAVATGTRFVQEFVGPAGRLDFSHEATRWRTFANRLRGRAFPPPTGQEPPRRDERDAQPGPGIAA
jgi:hypothetical protein